MIYVFRTHKINLTNLFLGILYVSAGAQVHGPCYYSINNDGFFDLIEGDFARHMCENPSDNFRNIDWPNNIDRLHEILDRVNKHLIFGSHHVDQIQYLKSQFGNKSITVAVNYDPDDYDLLLKNLAQNHVRLLQSNMIQANQHDQDLMLKLGNTDLVQHYQHEFDRMRLIPVSISDTFDYVIKVKDFYNKNKVADHVTNLGFEFSESAQKYYDYWISRQTA